MPPADREQVRRSIVRYLEVAAPHALTEPVLLQMLRSEGWRQLTAESLAAELDYLNQPTMQRGPLVKTEPKSVSPENRVWKITADGMDWHAQNC